MTPSERRVLALVLLWLASSLAFDLWLARAPHQVARWIGPAATAELAHTLPAPPGTTAPLRSAADSMDRREPSTAGAATAYQADGRLRLDDADSLALLALEGVGPVLAGRILAWRTRHGRFRGPGDLRAVKGIGPATLARLLPQISFERSASAAAGGERPGRRNEGTPSSGDSLPSRID